MEKSTTKNRKFKSLAFLGVFALSALVIVSCKKNNDPDPSHGTDSTTDNGKMDAEWNSIGNIVQDVIEQEDSAGNLKTLGTGCANVTVDTGAKRITVDFGSGCQVATWDNRVRGGKIELTYTGRYRDSGSVITTWTDGYWVKPVLSDTIHLNGKRTVTNKGGSFGSGGIEFEVVVGDTAGGGYATLSQGTDNITWRSTRTRLWITDGSTAIWPWDDIYHISGTADGVDRTGRAYSMSVDAGNPLVYDLNCVASDNVTIPKSGILTVSPSGLADRIIDYGEGGGCDWTVKVTVGVFSFNITLL